MATTVENQPFSRIVEQRKTSSWSIGLPVAILVIVVVALLAWLAAKWSQSSQALTAVQQDAQQERVAMGQLQQRISQMEGDLTRLRDPGRTTILLQPAAKPKKGAASSGDPIQVGKLDVSQDGRAFAEAGTRPASIRGSGWWSPWRRRTPRLPARS